MTQNKTRATIAMIVVAIIISILAFAVNGVHKAFAIETTTETTNVYDSKNSKPREWTNIRTGEADGILENPYYVHRLAPHYDSNEEVWQKWKSAPQAFISWLYEDSHSEGYPDWYLYKSGLSFLPEDNFTHDRYWYIDNKLMHYNSISGYVGEISPSGNYTIVGNQYKPTLDKDAVYHSYYQDSDGYIFDSGLYELTFEGTVNDPSTVHLKCYNGDGCVEFADFEAHEPVKFYPSNRSSCPSVCTLWVGGKQLLEVTPDGVTNIMDTDGIITGYGTLSHARQSICLDHDGKLKAVDFDEETVLAENIAKFDGYFFLTEDGAIGCIDNESTLLLSGLTSFEEAYESFKELSKAYAHLSELERKDFEMKFAVKYGVPLSEVRRILTWWNDAVFGPRGDVIVFDELRFDGQ